MLGLIPKVLLKLVVEQAGQTGVEAVLKQSGFPADQAFRIDQAYSDEGWQRLLDAACQVLKLTQDEAEIALADCFGRDCVRRWPAWFQMSSSAKAFLERQPDIHNVMASSLKTSAERAHVVDKFRLETSANQLTMFYRSPNRLCGLYKAMALWILDHYGEHASIADPSCQKRGDTECRIEIRWPAENTRR